MSTNESSTEKTAALAENKTATTAAPDAKTEKVETKKPEAEKAKGDTKPKTDARAADPKPDNKGDKSERRDDDDRRPRRASRDDDDDRRPRRTSRDERDAKDDEPRGRRDARRDDDRRDDDRRPRRDEPRDERGRDDRPREDRPREERSRDDRPKDDRPSRDERPRDDRPKEDKPKDDRPRDDRDDRRERSSRDEDSRDDRDDDGDEGEGDGEDSGEQGAWYSTGYKEQESIDDREAAGGDTKTRRHWMRAGEEIEGVILDGGKSDKEKWKRKAVAPFCVWEHNFATEDADGELTFHDETCIAGRVGADGKAVRCWFCANRPKIKRRYVGHYTVATSWEGKKGVVRWGKKLLPANKRLMKKFRRQEARTGLLGTVWDICRTDEGSARIGDDWQMKDDRPYTDAELQDLLGENADISPIDYIEECRPKSYNQLEDEYGKAKFSDPGKRKRGGRDRRRRDDDRDSGRDDRGRDDRSRDDRGRDDDRRTERSRDDRDRDRPRERDDRRDEPRGDRSRDERPRGGDAEIPF